MAHVRPSQQTQKLVQMLRTGPAISHAERVTDRELLNRRFTLARLVVSLARATGRAYDREQARIDLEACEAECRRRGLLKS